jgi:starch phosphorylase
VESLLNSQSGLLGISGLTNDTRVLEEELEEHEDRRVRLAIEIFCYRAGKYIGAMLAAMGGSDAVIFRGVYPNDEEMQGKRLRLEQQYFFVSCSLQDMIRLHLRQGRHIEDFHGKWTFQMNDTHPSIAVAELMLLLVDEHGMDWDAAWDITGQALAYTNHTILPEALERWPLRSSLPASPAISRSSMSPMPVFCSKCAPDIPERKRVCNGYRPSMKRGSAVRMANLACVGSHTINGVAALHTELLKNGVLSDFHQLWPEKFVNVTNGVTPRRWMAVSNRDLSSLITRRIGGRWIGDLHSLRDLEPFASDSEFRAEWRKVQQAAKIRLANYIRDQVGTTVDPSSMFDIPVKRINARGST